MDHSVKNRSVPREQKGEKKENEIIKILLNVNHKATSEQERD
jgi:hypothetical protein